MAAVLVASELADTGHSTLGADLVGGEWSRPGFGLATDAWTATNPDNVIVGYGQVQQVEPDVVESWGSVHPDHRGLAIGTSLFKQLECRPEDMLAGQPSPRLRHAIENGDRGAEAIVAAGGLQPVRHFRHMEIELVGTVRRTVDPEGITIAGAEAPDDQRAAHAVIDEALSEHWGHHREPFDTCLADLTGPGYDPGLWLLAYDGDTPVGALTGSLGEIGGWIDWLGVRESWRGRGIAAALLQHCFGLFAARGITQVQVSVDAANASGATGVYERAGMRVVKAWTMWERGA